MKRLSWLFSFLCLFSAMACAEPLALVHVWVIDATGAAPRRDQTVVVAEGRIVKVGPSSKVKVPAGAQVVHGRGKYLIPGLWDMHVHSLGVGDKPWSDEVILPLYIASGITGVRDMGGNLEALRKRRKRIESGEVLGPRMVIAGPFLDGGKGDPVNTIQVRTAEEGRAAVDRLKREGVDFIKVLSVPRAAYFAIAEESHKAGLPLAGHVSEGVSALEVSDAGQKSIEHLSGLFLASSSEEERLRKERSAAAARHDWAAYEQLGLKVLETYSPEKEAALAARFVKNGTWQVPTLVWTYSTTRLEEPGLATDPRLTHVPSWARAQWDPEKLKKGLVTGELEAEKKAFAHYLELVGEMRRQDVRFLAGSDSPDPYVFPGSSLHEELALLVKAGLTPLEALEAATRNAAEFLGREKDLGTVEEGKQADLVLLDADPLADIHNTQRIDAVVVRGRYLPRRELDKLLQRQEQAATAAR